MKFNTSSCVPKKALWVASLLLTAIASFAQSTAVRINAGGGTYVDTLGNTWAADYAYNGGSKTTSPSGVTGTNDPQLFTTERYDLPAAPELQYTIPIANGSYVVRLYFAETYAPTKGAGLRVFDVDIQGTRAFEDVDIFTQAGGGDKALVLESTATVTNGQLTIGFVHQVENPKVNAIEIISADSQAPTTPGSLTFSAVTSTSATISWGAATDNVGVTGYRVSRGSTSISTVSGSSFTDTGLSPGTSYTYSVVALDAAGNVSAPRTGTIATPSSTASSVVRINAGGPSYTDAAGNNWSADSGYNGGSTTTTTATVTGTADPQLFKTERYDLPAAPELQYTITVPNGSYFVRMYFAETYAANKGVGLRVFDIDVQGTRAFEDVDIYAQAGGGNKALVLQAPANVVNGQITIGFVHQVENPKVNAIEIIPAGARINAGSTTAYTDAAGNTWAADFGSNTGSKTTSTATVIGTNDPQLFKTERYDLPAAPELAYTIPTPNGSYLVRLYFAETYAANKGAGLRVFDVDVQGVRAFEDVDIFVRAGGGDKALVLETPATVANGQLTIGFVHQVENPKINAIEVLPYTPPATAYFTSFEEFAVGAVNGQNGWSGTAGTAVITGNASNLVKSIKLPAGANSLTKQFASLGGTGGATYLDFFLKPAFSASIDTGSFVDAGGVQVAFLQSSDGLGKLQVLNSSGQGTAEWLTVGPAIALNSSKQATGWQQLTFRVNFTTKRWDMFLNGQLVAPGLPVSSTDAFLPFLTTYGATAADSFFDDVYLGLTSPLAADAVAPSTPSSLTKTAVTSGSVSLFWAPSTSSGGVQKYNIYRNGVLVGSTSGMNTYYTDTGLSANTAYTYTVQATNADDVASAQSTSISAITASSTTASLEVFTPLK